MGGSGDRGQEECLAQFPQGLLQQDVVCWSGTWELAAAWPTCAPDGRAGLWVPLLPFKLPGLRSSLGHAA